MSRQHPVGNDGRNNAPHPGEAMVPCILYLSCPMKGGRAAEFDLVLILPSVKTENQ